MIKYIILTAVALLTFQLNGYGQQDPGHTYYMFNGMGINPGYAGSRGMFSANLILRKQWVALDGAPTTGTVSFNAPSANQRHGYGMTIVHDQLGITRQNFITASYAYRLPLAGGTLGLGLRGGVTNYSNLYSKLETTEQDLVNPGLDQQAWLPRVGTGFFFNTERFYLGFSVPNLISDKYFRYKDQTAQQIASIQRIHYYATTGVVIPLSDNVEFKPSVLMKYVENSPVEFDLNASFLFKQALWVGAGYRTGDALMFLLEYQTPKGLRLGYAYDWTVTQLGQVNTGSHEILLGIDLGRNRQNIISPRFF